MTKRDLIPMRDAEAAILPIVEAALAAIGTIPDYAPEGGPEVVAELLRGIEVAVRNRFLQEMRASALTLQALERARKGGQNGR